MPEFHLSAALLFLVPGLLAYCGFYGVFGGGTKISVAPPPANSIEALTIILLASLFAHAAAFGLVAVDGAVCGTTGRCLGLPDLSATMFESSGHGGADPAQAKQMLLATLIEGGATYLLIWLWLKWRTWTDRLPTWLYGWTAELANMLDNPDRLVVAYVLTNQDVGGKSVVYTGSVVDMTVARDGVVARITLGDCERYLVGMDKPLASGPPLSEFTLMTIEQANIRNIAFELFVVADPAAPPALAA